jgi:hypothetical protein
MSWKAERIRARGRIVQGELPLLWPDENGNLTLPQPWEELSSESPWRRWLPWRRAAKVSQLRLPRSRSLSLWLSERRSGGALSFMGNESRFENWLSGVLLATDYQCMSLGLVIEGAQNDLHLERQEVIRLLIKATSARGKFKSLDGMISVRDN